VEIARPRSSQGERKSFGGKGGDCTSAFTYSHSHSHSLIT
jgi:hypothetical protein